MGIKLTPQQEEQIRSMIKDGKKNKEIQEFFKATYQVDVPSWKLSYMRKADPLILTQPKERRAKKKAVDPEGGENIDAVVKEIVLVLKQIDSGYKAIFMHLRKELIKSRAEVYEMMRGAGIETPEEKGRE